MGLLFGWLVSILYNSTYCLPLGAAVQHLCVSERERGTICMCVCVCAVPAFGWGKRGPCPGR
jgi:hypothetical protein